MATYISCFTTYFCRVFTTHSRKLSSWVVVVKYIFRNLGVKSKFLGNAGLGKADTKNHTYSVFFFEKSP